MFKLQESELRTVKDSPNAALEFNNELKLELKATKQRVKELEEEICELYENIDTLDQQYTTKNSLQIEGIPENVCNDQDAVLKVSEILNANVTQEDIDICHRIIHSEHICGSKGFINICYLPAGRSVQ